MIQNRQRVRAKFRGQHIIGPYTVDLCCPAAKLVVECDVAPHFTDEGKKRDARRTKWLEEQGNFVLRFTSDQIRHETQSKLSATYDARKKRFPLSKTPHPPSPSPRSTEEKGG